MGSPEGWGDHSPHPFGEPSPSRWRTLRKKKNEVNPMYMQFFLPRKTKVLRN